MHFYIILFHIKLVMISMLYFRTEMTADYDVCSNYYTMSRSQRRKNGGGVTSTEGELNYFLSS